MLSVWAHFWVYSFSTTASLNAWFQNADAHESAGGPRVPGRAVAASQAHFCLSLSWAGLPLHFLGGSLPVIFLPQSQTPAGISATSQPQGSACRAVCSEKRPGLGTRVPEPRQACKVSCSWLRLFGVGLRGCLFDPFFCSQGRGLSLAVCFLSSACLATPGEESREDTPTVVWDSHPLGLAGANVVSECHCFMRSLSPSVKGNLFLDVPWVSDSCSVMPDFLQPHGL